MQLIWQDKQALRALCEIVEGQFCHQWLRFLIRRLRDGFSVLHLFGDKDFVYLLLFC